MGGLVGFVTGFMVVTVTGTFLASKVGVSVEAIGDLVECGLSVGSIVGVGGLIEGFGSKVEAIGDLVECGL